MLAIKLAAQDTQKVCRAPRWPSNSHPKTPKKSVVHHAGHQTRIPRHPKVCRAPHWPLNSHPKTPKKSVVHHAGHQTRIPRHPKSLSCTTLAIKLASQHTQKVCRAPRWPSNSHPKTPKKSVVHHAGHQTRIPRHPKSLSCTTRAIKLAAQDTQKVCRAPRWLSNSHPKTPKKSVVHHAGHQTHPKSLSFTTLAIKLASQDTQKNCRAPRWPSNSHPKTPKKSVVHHAGHQTRILRHPKKSVLHHAGHQTRIPRHPDSLSCTTLAIKLTSQDTQKVCRAPRWPSNSHPKTPKKSVVRHAGHQTRIPRHAESLSCTTLAIKLASQDTQKVCRAPCWPSNSHPKTPKKSVLHHADHQTRIPRHPESLSCTTLAIKLAAQDTQKVCRAPRWPSMSHPKTPKQSVVQHHAGHQTRIPRHPKSLSCTTLAFKLASQDAQKVCRAPRWPSMSHPKTPKKSVVHHAGHQTRIPTHPKSLPCTTLAIKLASQDTQKSVVHHDGHQPRIPRHPKSLSCTTLAIKLFVCRAPRWPSNSHPKTPKKSVVHHAGHQTVCLSCTTLAIKLASQDTQKVCRAPRWPSNSHPKTPKESVVHCRAARWPSDSHPKTHEKSVVHYAGHQTRIPRHPKSLSCTTLAIKLASQDTQKVYRARRWPSNSHPKTPKKSVVHHAGHQTRIPGHPKSLSCTMLAIKLASQNTQKVCRAPRWPSNSHPKTPRKTVVHQLAAQDTQKSLSCATLAIKLASQDTQKVCRAQSLLCTTLAIKLASQDTQKICRAPRWPSNSYPKTPKTSVVHHAGHQTRIPKHAKSLSCTTLAIKFAAQDTQKSLSFTRLAIKLAAQDTQKVYRAPRWPSNSHPETPKKSVVHHAGHETRIPRHPKVCRAPRWPLNSHPKTPKKSVVHHTGHKTRIPRHPKSLSCTRLAIKLAYQDTQKVCRSCTMLAIKLASQNTQKVCRAPRWPSNSHPKTPKKSVVHHAGHQTRIPRHPKSLSCTTLAIKLTSSRDSQKGCRAPRWPSNSHPKTPKKSVVHHAGHQTRTPRHPKSLSCTTLAIKLASQDTQKVCRAPCWPTNSHPKTPKKSVVHHAGHQTRIPRHPKSLSCTTLAIKLASQDTHTVCRAPRWPSNSHPKTPKKSVVHHAGHQTRIPRHPKSLSCTTLAIKLASQDTQKVCRAPRWPSNSHPKTPKKSVVHHAGHQTRIPRPRCPSNSHPKTPKKSVVHHASHQTRIPRHPKSLSCTMLAIKLASQDTQKVCRAPRWP